MTRLHDAMRWLASSLVAAALASVAAGLLEGLAFTGRGLDALASAGFAAIGGAPVALVAAVIARGLWAAWQPAALGERLTEADGGAPVLAAWLAYLLAACVVLSVGVFNALKVLYRFTTTANVIALGAVLAALASALVLVLISRPAIDGLAWVLRRFGGARLTARAVWGGAIVGSALTVIISWSVSAQRLLGYVDPALFAYPALVAAVLMLAHVGWGRLGPAGRQLAGGLASAALAAAAGAAVYARLGAPAVMLSVWGGVPAGGAAIDRVLDIHQLRDELPLEHVAPVARTERHANVVLITIDTVRADRTPLYGGPAHMPRLFELARHAAVFDWVLAPGNVTRRSVPTIATGLSPNRIRGRVAGWALRLDPRHVLLAERLRAAGYDTAGFHCCVAFFAPQHRLGWIRGLDTLELEYDAKPLVARALAWLEARDDAGARRPYFLWMHILEPHLWEKLYPEGDSKLTIQQRYDKVLTDVDAALAPLLDYLQADDRLADTVVVITSDHGEGLGERGARFHGTNLYNSQLRVPLVVAGPGIAPARVPQPVSLVDVAPTLLELAGFEPPGLPDMDGVSFAPMVRGEAVPRRDDGESYSVMVADRSVEQGGRALLVGRFKLIQMDGERPELYDVLADPNEKTNIATSRSELVDELRRRLSRRIDIDAVPPW